MSRYQSLEGISEMTEVVLFEGEIELVRDLQINKSSSRLSGTMETTRYPPCDDTYDRVHVTSENSLIVMEGVVFTETRIEVDTVWASVEFVAMDVSIRHHHHKT